MSDGKGQEPIPGGLIGNAGVSPGSTVFRSRIRPAKGPIGQSGVEPSHPAGHDGSDAFYFWAAMVITAFAFVLAWFRG